MGLSKFESNGHIWYERTVLEEERQVSFVEMTGIALVFSPYDLCYMLQLLDLILVVVMIQYYILILILLD